MNVKLRKLFEPLYTQVIKESREQWSQSQENLTGKKIKVLKDKRDDEAVG